MWNEIQKREIVDLHQIDPARVVVTGSQVFDDWFEKAPSTTRDAFCARVGLRPDRPILLYVCSALLEGSPPESGSCFAGHDTCARAASGPLGVRHSHPPASSAETNGKHRF